MSYLLDTNSCIQLLTGESHPTLVRLRVEIARTSIFVSTIVLFELWYGVHRSSRPEQNRSRVERLLSMGVELLEFSNQDAETAGQIRASLQSRKEPIGPYDTLIAGQALARGLTLVTSNHREFSRLEGLRWEDWSQT